MKYSLPLLSALLFFSNNSFCPPPEFSPEKVKKLEKMEKDILYVGKNSFVYLCAVCKHYSGQELTSRARVLLHNRALSNSDSLNLAGRSVLKDESWQWPIYHRDLLALRATEHEGCRVLQQRLQEFEKKKQDIKCPDLRNYKLESVGLPEEQREKIQKDSLQEYRQNKRKYHDQLDNLIDEVFHDVSDIQNVPDIQDKQNKWYSRFFKK